MSKLAVPDYLMEDILETSFGDHNGSKDEYFVADMISCLMKKVGYKSLSLTDLQKEKLANLLVLFQEEEVSLEQIGAVDGCHDGRGPGEWLSSRSSREARS